MMVVSLIFNLKKGQHINVCSEEGHPTDRVMLLSYIMT